MTPAYVAMLGLTTWKTSIRAQKIDSLTLETYGMALASFSLQDSKKMVRFFKETFLLANTSMEMVIKILFLFVSNADFQFNEEELM